MMAGLLFLACVRYPVGIGGPASLELAQDGRPQLYGALPRNGHQSVVKYVLSGGRFQRVAEGGFGAPSDFILDVLPLRNGWIAIESISVRNRIQRGQPSLSIVRFDGHGRVVRRSRAPLKGTVGLCTGFHGGVLFAAGTSGATSYRVTPEGGLRELSSAKLRLTGYQPSATVDAASHYLSVLSVWNPIGNRNGFQYRVAVEILPSGRFGGAVAGLPPGFVTDGAYAYEAVSVDAQGEVTAVRCFRSLAAASEGVGGKVYAVVGRAPALAVDSTGSRVFFSKGGSHDIFWEPLRPGAVPKAFASLGASQAIGMGYSSDGAYLVVTPNGRRRGSDWVTIFSPGVSGPPAPLGSPSLPSGIMSWRIAGP